jgi:ParB family chromosome partitioning protein
MNNKKEALGKGIRALLDTIDTGVSAQPQTAVPLSNSVNEIPLEYIEVNPFQPRVDFDEARLKELADSIKIHGVIQPITVKKLTSKKYQLIAGERRLRASKMAGLTAIPAFVRTANDQEMLEIALIENTHREDLNAHEVAINYKRLMDECNLTQENLAERVGKDRATVANYLRLLKLPPDIQLAIKNRTISMTHARAIISIDDPVAQLSLYKDIISKDLSVRAVEQLARTHKKSNKPVKHQRDNLPYELKRVQDKLASHLSTRVLLKNKRGGRGEIVISYFSDDDLQRLMDLMNL